jgi:predicted amidohydrolase|tara:strand:- start:6 stop:809 length:804 start_codon:yes stop_codon:yes gene_type:complete
MIRIAGAQIPVTKDPKENIKHIKAAIDWAEENQVDVLLTPEGSLSGYLNTFDNLLINSSNLQNLCNEVVLYAVSKNIQLALGTEYIKTFNFGKVKTSQIRYYNTSSKLIGHYVKQMTIPLENAYPGKGPKIVEIEGTNASGPYNFKVGSFICNDMWGQLDKKQIVIEDLFYYRGCDSKIIFHATNGVRGPDTQDDIINEKLKEFADINLWMSSKFGVPIVTVDNCYTCSGDHYNGPTSSTSGIILNGEWLVKAAPTGIDYFYYDFNF